MNTQIINLDYLKAQFGADLSEKIKEDITYSRKQKEEFKIEILAQTFISTKIAFSTDAYTKIYVVSNNGKSVVDELMVGFYECERILNIMQEITKKSSNVPASLLA